MLILLILPPLQLRHVCFLFKDPAVFLQVHSIFYENDISFFEEAQKLLVHPPEFLLQIGHLILLLLRHQMLINFEIRNLQRSNFHLLIVLCEGLTLVSHLLQIVHSLELLRKIRTNVEPWCHCLIYALLHNLWSCEVAICCL